MKRAFVTRTIAGLALLAVALGAVAFQAKAADAQVPFVTAGGPYAGTAGVPVRFNAASNVGAVTSVAWTFGDGTGGSGFTVLKTYAVPGVYSVSVTVTNIAGQSFTATTTATIGGAVVPNCQFVTLAAGCIVVTNPGVVVCSATDRGPGGCSAVPVVTPVVTPIVRTVVLPGTVLVNTSCLAILSQFGFIPTSLLGCR